MELHRPSHRSAASRCHNKSPIVIALLSATLVGFLAAFYWGYYLPAAYNADIKPKKSTPVFDGPYWRNNQTISARLVFDHPRIRMESHDIRLDSGQIIRDWLWIDETPTVSVLVHLANPPDPAKPFVVFRQQRYAINFADNPGVHSSLAAPGGYLEKNESPLTAARRELLEELRFESDDWVDLGWYRVNANRGMGLCYSYLAVNARRSLKFATSDDLTVGDRVYMSFAELRQAVRENQFIEVKWSSTVAFGILALMDRGYTGNGPMPPPLPLQSITLASTTTSAAPSSSLSSSFSAPDVRDAGADAGIGASLGVISEGGPVKITQRGPALT